MKRTNQTLNALNRRTFLKRAGAAAGGVVALPYFIPARALGRDGAVAPSERIVLGAIGIGNRGSYVLGCFLPEPGVQFVAIAEVKEERRLAVKKKADDLYGNKDCVMYRDCRELLARTDIDAVLIATGPNWHAAAATLAANAGKDVYCEKPCTKNIAESLALAETFRRTGRVFQAGTQRRSLPNFAFAAELARTGKLGKLHTLHAHPMGLKAEMSGWLPEEPSLGEALLRSLGNMMDYFGCVGSPACSWPGTDLSNDGVSRNGIGFAGCAGAVRGALRGSTIWGVTMTINSVLLRLIDLDVNSLPRIGMSAMPGILFN